MNAVGIDVSKKKSTVSICQPGNVVLLPPRDFRHTLSSINELIETISNLDGETKVCMEHTGRYYEPIAARLSAAGIFVSAVNPKLIRDFGNESLRAPKTDKADSSTAPPAATAARSGSILSTPTGMWTASVGNLSAPSPSITETGAIERGTISALIKPK